MNTRFALVSVIVGALAVIVPAEAWAGNPVELTDGQLDRVTAGLATVLGVAGAQATGALVITQTGTSSLGVGGGAPFPDQPVLQDDAAATVASAVAQGTNANTPGLPPPTSSTSVTTQGSAVGNLVIGYTFNTTVHGAGNVTAQLGYTVVFGMWAGL